MVTVKKIQLQKNGVFEDSQTTYVPQYKNRSFKAIPDPETSGWPQGKPTWAASGADIETNPAIGPTVTARFNSLSSSINDYKTLTASCGNSKTANSVAFSATISKSGGWSSDNDYFLSNFVQNDLLGWGPITEDMTPEEIFDRIPPYGVPIKFHTVYGLEFMGSFTELKCKAIPAGIGNAVGLTSFGVNQEWQQNETLYDENNALIGTFSQNHGATTVETGSSFVYPEHYDFTTHDPDVFYFNDAPGPPTGLASDYFSRPITNNGNTVRIKKVVFKQTFVSYITYRGERMGTPVYWTVSATANLSRRNPDGTFSESDIVWG